MNEKDKLMDKKELINQILDEFDKEAFKRLNDNSDWDYTDDVLKPILEKLL